MYGQRNTSGVYVHFNKHGYKAILHKFDGLKYSIKFWRNYRFRAFVWLNI